MPSTHQRTDDRNLSRVLIAGPELSGTPVSVRDTGVPETADSDFDRRNAPTADTDQGGTKQSSRTDESSPTGAPVRDYRGAGIMWTAVAPVVAVALFVVVALQNTQDVDFSFLWFDVSAPLILILAITFGAALVVGEVIGFVWRRRRRTRLRERDELRRLRKKSA